MLDVTKVATYIYERYMAEKGTKIDEMKLHKLLYLTQRESIIMTDAPMFDAQFAAWKYGPVMVQIRSLYKDNKLNIRPSSEECAPYKDVFDSVFTKYADKDSWSLSTLTHGEISWQLARKGYAQDAQCDVPIKTKDIVQDAQRIKIRRFYFNEVLPQLYENK